MKQYNGSNNSYNNNNNCKNKRLRTRRATWTEKVRRGEREKIKDVVVDETYATLVGYEYYRPNVLSARVSQTLFVRFIERTPKTREVKCIHITGASLRRACCTIRRAERSVMGGGGGGNVGRILKVVISETRRVGRFRNGSGRDRG